MIHLARGRITAILAVRPGAVELSVAIEGEESKAIAYPGLVGELAVGDEVLLNTTAVRLGLGTGGYHFILARLSPPPEECLSKSPGHIIKLRYTPLQHAVTSVEEEKSPHREAIERFTTLDGMPVLVGELHSQLLPAIIGARYARQSLKAACIMPDTASLPLAFSRTVALLKEKGWIEASITAGQAFGGDLEAVNLHTALIAAKEVAGADLTIITQGPGNVGTGTRYGFSGMAVSEALHAAHILGGKPVAIPRISFADNRKRHQGLSHHTQTVLGRATLVRVLLPMPLLGGEKQKILEEQLEACGLSERHEVKWVSVEGIREILTKDDVGAVREPPLRIREVLQTMDRGFESDPEFFIAAAVAGREAIR